jgi:hypothetical protein
VYGLDGSVETALTALGDTAGTGGGGDDVQFPQAVISLESEQSSHRSEQSVLVLT